MKYPKWFPIALAAGFGGIAPNVFRLGTDLQAGRPLPDLSYVIGVTVFFIMGAGVALAFEEDNAKKALFLGLSLPAMFQSGVGDVTAGVARLMDAPIAYAAEEPPHYVKVVFNEDAPEFSIIFSSDKRKGRAEEYPEKTEDGYRVAVPSWAETFSVLVIAERQMSKSSLALRSFVWEIEITPAPLRGLKSAFGNANAPRWRIEVSKRDEDTDY